MVLDQVEALGPRIAARAAEIEAARRLPADLAGELAAAGLFRMAVPRALGGLEVPPATLLAAIEGIAAADASVGWCVMIGTTSGIVSAYLPQAEARVIYGDPLGITGGVFAPMGKAEVEGDGYRLSGRWSWASGSVNCQWLMAGAMVARDGKPEARMFLLPAAQVQLHDTWHVAGLSGTGSGDMSIDNRFVPATRSVSLMTDRPWATGPLYAFPVFGLLALGISAVMLGNARAALADFAVLARAKTPQGSRRSLAERAQVQADYAKAEAALSAARALLEQTVATAWEQAQKGGLDTAIRARLRLAATHAARTSADVVRTMYDLGGGSSVFLASPLQRRFRDGHVGTQHAMVAPATYELAGRVLLGLETDTAQL